jgi:hypothetical protein
VLLTVPTRAGKTAENARLQEVNAGLRSDVRKLYLQLNKNTVWPGNGGGRACSSAALPSSTPTMRAEARRQQLLLATPRRCPPRPGRGGAALRPT